MSPLDLVSYAVLAFVGVRLVTAVRVSYGTREHVRVIVRGLRVRHFLLAIPVFAVVLTVAFALLHVPLLSFGWWTAMGGAGNPVTGSTSRTNGTPFEFIIPIVFIALLMVGLPVFAEREEQVFRAGAEQRTTLGNLRKSVFFGIVHAVVGIPIGVALALSVGGVYFTWAYLREWRRTRSVESALLESTRSHLAYNALILTLALVYYVLVAVSA